MRQSESAWWHWTRLVLLGVFLATVMTVVAVIPLLPTERVILEAGDVASRDVRAPSRITYESAILGAEQEQRAAASVAPVFTPPDSGIARQQLDRARQVIDYIGSVRADPFSTQGQKRAWIVAVPELSEAPIETLDRILSLSEEGWNRAQLETLAVVDQAMRGSLREGGLEEAYQSLLPLVSLDLTADEAAVTVALTQSFLIPNSFLDPDATTQAQARARENVSPVLRTFEADEIIVREGQRVTALDIEALDELGLRQAQVKWPDFIGPGVLMVLGTLLTYALLARLETDVLWSGSALLMFVLAVAAFTLGARLMVPGGAVLRYLFPAAALAMVLASAVGLHAALAGAVFVGYAAGVIADYSLEVITFTVVGGLIAALASRRVERMADLFQAGALAALGQAAVVAAFHVPQGIGQPVGLVVSFAAAIANGGISASLALGLLFLIGPLFDVVTTMRLIELSRPDRPLLQRLLREAPATYHHSLMVANLAEQAAEHIDANALLTRVGAYYHDIGKLVQPYWFTENQMDGLNPHDELDPHASVEVIVDHVRDGLALARRYHLPSRIRAFIPEHHGTNWISFFHSKALESADDPAQIRAEDFRYPGPRPQSRESALVMLADGCEAAVRSIRPATPEQVAEIVNRVIDSRIEAGQLDECDMTLRDLDTVREVYTSALKGMFHPRIQYPQATKPAEAQA
ncbi:MAG: HDIG domain-containing protein [Chloroflexi bacterium]|nr:HDIG domain-containing protein [Chloroflexota bacterium]